MSNNPIERLLPLQSHKNEEIADLANKAVTYSNELVAGNITKEEYNDLMDGLARTKLISKKADDLADIETLKAIILLLIDIYTNI